MRVPPWLASEAWASCAWAAEQTPEEGAVRSSRMCRVRRVYQKAGGSRVLVTNMYVLCQSPLFSDPEYRMAT